MAAFNPTPNVFSKYGAPMGRHGDAHGVEILGCDPPVALQRVRLDSGGYDAGGAYWGHDIPLYAYQLETDGEFHTGYLRARDRDAAKAEIRDMHGAACRFYR